MALPTQFKAVAEESRDRLDRLVDKRGVGDLKQLYQMAHEELARKLSELAGSGRGDTMNAHQLRVILAQVQQGERQIMRRMAGALGGASLDTQTAALRGLIKDIRRLETTFTGSSQALPIEEAARFHGVIDKNRTSLLKAHATSMSRYGSDLVTKMEGQLVRSLLTGESQQQAIDRISKTADLSWGQGERIVRTELSWAYNATHADGIAATSEDLPDMMMRWSEHVADEGYAPLDNRVAVDSIAMHGQVARPGGAFTMPPSAPHADSKGRQDVPAALIGKTWVHPPNRPNDRAVVQPWRARWGIPGWTWSGGLRVPVTAPVRAGRTRTPEISTPSATPARAPAPAAESPLLTTIATAPIESVKALRGGGENTSYTVQFEDGEKAIFKPRSGESGSETIPKGGYADREIAVGDVGRMLGVEVPETVIRKIAVSRGDKPEEGSLQAWATGAVEAHEADDNVPRNRASFERVRALDYITGNVDRHGGNVMYRMKDGEYHAVGIDHGYALHESAPKHGLVNAIHGAVDSVTHGGKTLPETVAAVDAIDEKELVKTLRAAKISAKASELAVRRLVRLKQDPSLIELEGALDWNMRITDSDQGLTREEKARIKALVQSVGEPPSQSTVSPPLPSGLVRTKNTLKETVDIDGIPVKFTAKLVNEGSYVNVMAMGPDDQHVGSVHFAVDTSGAHPSGNKGLFAGYVQTAEKFRRKGVASRMYAMAESLSGHSVQASSTQTDMGKAFSSTFRARHK